MQFHVQPSAKGIGRQVRADLHRGATAQQADAGGGTQPALGAVGQQHLQVALGQPGHGGPPGLRAARIVPAQQVEHPRHVLMRDGFAHGHGGFALHGRGQNQHDSGQGQRHQRQQRTAQPSHALGWSA
jgi:hypothetical protein